MARLVESGKLTTDDVKDIEEMLREHRGREPANANPIGRSHQGREPANASSIERSHQGKDKEK
jgi:hypothetical protein